MSAMQADVLSCFVLPLPRVSRSFNSNKEFDRFFCSVFFFFFIYFTFLFSYYYCHTHLPLKAARPKEISTFLTSPSKVHLDLEDDPYFHFNRQFYFLFFILLPHPIPFSYVTLFRDLLILLSRRITNNTCFSYHTEKYCLLCISVDRAPTQTHRGIIEVEQCVILYNEILYFITM
jgi:hypothetical protein